MPSKPILGVISSNYHRRITSRLYTSILLLAISERSLTRSNLGQSMKCWSSSSSRWRDRQIKDPLAREARVKGLKSRAAFKLLEIDLNYSIFKKGQTVVDLGYAPGSWSQVAVERTKPNGRVLGIDIIPAQPPKGVSTIQGNFLCPNIQNEAKRFLSQPDYGRPKSDLFTRDTQLDPEISYISEQEKTYFNPSKSGSQGREEEQKSNQRMVDVVLSDMSAPWIQTNGFWIRTLSDPYLRMMNISGLNLKDHVGSMELCNSALEFAKDTLRIGGNFVCKFYQGAEDKELENKLRDIFKKVHREKPESSRKESREAFFVALQLKSI